MSVDYSRYCSNCCLSNVDEGKRYFITSWVHYGTDAYGHYPGPTHFPPGAVNASNPLDQVEKEDSRVQIGDHSDKNCAKSRNVSVIKRNKKYTIRKTTS